MKNLFFLSILFFIFSCGKDENSNSNTLVGSYVAKSLRNNCTINPENDIDISFEDNEDCFTVEETYDNYKYCKSGKLIIKEDDTYSSSIKINRTSLGLNLTLHIFNFNTSGTVSQSGNTVVFCKTGGACSDFALNNDILTFSNEVGDCKLTVKLKKE